MTADVLDSSFSEPTDAQLEAAKAAGVRGWCGYAASRPALEVGFAHTWPKATFDRVRSHGLVALAFVSGFDDPGAVAALLQAWGLRGALDVEGGGLRDVGPWIPGWLADSGGAAVALYGNGPVHGYRAPAHIVSAYPAAGDPGGQSWPSWLARPATPCGWQWAGSHVEFGAQVDSEWWDESLLAWAGDATKEDDMRGLLVTYGGAIWLVDPTLVSRVWVEDPGDLAALQSTGNYLNGPQLSAQQMSRIPIVGPTPEEHN